ncbi:hypothetical protein [Halobacterium salinarum]|uniref:hypothetical protein n=1 Tax=Halobacterium salinarum TaxID=2242 RepID=UPI0025558266|nr:hypothetical protein [Halobacterium salinarum]MDL0129061.1 hypothetical protein [Halobacterium salinarum]MDL0144602.1 hypothetical protein [Halobacterium salinarum]
MTTLTLDYPREDTRTIVKAAFENTRGIKQYNDDGHRVIGKSGMGLASYGEQVTVEIPEDQAGEEQTMVTVTAEKEVSMNITANPDKYKSRFLQELESLRGRHIDSILDGMSETMDPKQSKEVSDSGELRDGSSSMGIVMVVMMALSILFMFVMMAAIMP